ncbi:MAG: hypothetical protein RL105_200 [Verrucomicrobiota bacterium]|jgi:hypothetical protein
MTFSIIALLLFTTGLGRYLVASRGGDFGHEGRRRTLAETLLVWMSGFSCALILAERFAGLGPWLSEPQAPWTALPALFWTLGMLAVPEHPLDRTAFGTGLSTLLPHVYVGVLQEMQVPATPLAVGLFLFTAAWCWRRKDGSEA